MLFVPTPAPFFYFMASLLQSHMCAHNGALPAPLYFLMRNNLEGLLEMAREAIKMEAATGTAHIQSMRTNAVRHARCGLFCFFFVCLV